MSSVQTQERKQGASLYFIVKIILAVALFLAMLYLPELQQRKWLHQLVNGVWTFLLPSLVVSIVRFILISIYNTRHAKRPVRGNFVLGISQLTIVLNVIFFLIALMVAFGTNPVEFLTGLTIVAMAIAVTFRDYITNMISGLLIMFSDQLSIGDRIKTGNEEGRVEDITLSNIVLKNEEDDIVMVPNNFFYTQPVVNLSMHRSQFFYVKFELPLGMAQHSSRLEEDLRTFFAANPELAGSQNAPLLVEEINKDAVKFRVELTAVSSSDRIHRKIENDVLKQILVFKTKYEM